MLKALTARSILPEDHGPIEIGKPIECDARAAGKAWGIAPLVQSPGRGAGLERARVNRDGFVPSLTLPHNLRMDDLALAMDDIYVTLASANGGLTGRGLLRIEESLRGANFTAFLSDLLVVALAKHAMGLTQNRYPNGHPDLLPTGQYTNDSERSAPDGVEVKATKRGPAVDMHGCRPGWYCVFRYVVDATTQPVVTRTPTRFSHIWLAQLGEEDFRRNPRQSALSTRTASPNRAGVVRLRTGLVYADEPVSPT